MFLGTGAGTAALVAAARLSPWRSALLGLRTTGRGREGGAPAADRPPNLA